MKARATLKYNKVLNVIGQNFVNIYKISDLSKVLIDFNIENISISVSKLSKTLKVLESNKISFDIDYSWGFEWECKIILKYN